MTTPMFPVKSSQISYIGYDEDNNELYVTFSNDTTYKYSDVPKEVYNELSKAKSVGKYFAQNIKNKYSTIKVNIHDA